MANLQNKDLDNLKSNAADDLIAYDHISKEIFAHIHKDNKYKSQFFKNNSFDILQFKTAIRPLKRKLKSNTFFNKLKFYTFDTETKDGLKGSKLFCYAWAWNHRIKYRLNGRNAYRQELRSEVRYADNLDDFFDYFRKLNLNKKHPETSIIYVHNLGFDVRFVDDWCKKHKIEVVPVLSGSNMLAYFIEDFNIKFIDTFQFLWRPQHIAEKEWLLDIDLVNEYYPPTINKRTIKLTNLIKNFKEIIVQRDQENKAELEYQKSLMKIDCTHIFNKPYNIWVKSEKLRVLKHNRNDVCALHRCMYYFGAFVYTAAKVNFLTVISIASLALKAFRATLGPLDHIINPFIERVGHEYKFNDYNKEKYEFIKNAYFGGRTEVYRLMFAKLVDYVDRVSMYPAELDFQVFPVGNPIWVHGHKDIMEQLTKFKLLGFVMAEVQAPSDMLIPILPCKLSNEQLEDGEMFYGGKGYRNGKERLGKVCFTNERFKGYFTSVELLYAKSKGYDIKCIKALIYPHKLPLFRKYIQKFFKLKSQHTGGRREAGKRFLNSFYGKMGQNIEQEKAVFIYRDTEDEVLEELEDLDIVPDKHGYNIIYSEEFLQFYNVSLQESELLKPHQNMAHPAFVTSYSRISLHQLNYKLLMNAIALYYNDTDSCGLDRSKIIYEKYPGRIRNLEEYNKYMDVIIQKCGKKYLFYTSHDLGGWDIENSFKRVRFLAPKAYFFQLANGQFKIKLKGAGRLKIEAILKEIELLQRYEGFSDDVFMEKIDERIRKEIEMFERYDTYNHSLRSGKSLATKTLTKHFSFDYFKRRVGKDLTTTPYGYSK